LTLTYFIFDNVIYNSLAHLWSISFRYLQL